MWLGSLSGEPIMKLPAGTATISGPPSKSWNHSTLPVPGRNQPSGARRIRSSRRATAWQTRSAHLQTVFGNEPDHGLRPETKSPLSQANC
jgi:hypothetical protein